MSHSLENRGGQVGNIRVASVKTEALSHLCILVASQVVIGLQFNPQGSQFSVFFFSRLYTYY